MVINVKPSSSNPHKTLTRLITANIVLDITAIAIWASLPANIWNGMYRLDSLIAGSEAALAAAFFAVTLFGLIKIKNGAHSRNRHHRNSTNLRRLRIFSKYSDTNNPDLEFGNNLLCHQRNKNFKKYLLINFVNDGLSIFRVFGISSFDC